MVFYTSQRLTFAWPLIASGPLLWAVARNVAAFWGGAIAILWLLGLWLRDTEGITVFGDVDRFFSDLTLPYPPATSIWS